MTLSLRASLTAWFTGLASLVVGAGSVALYLGVRSSLYEGLDAMLEAQAKGVGALCEWEHGAVHLEGYYEFSGHQPLLEGDHGFEVRLQPGGEVQIRKGLALPEPRPGHREGAETYGDLRVITVPITFAARAQEEHPGGEPASPGFTVDVRTAASLQPVEQQLATIRWFALLISGISTASVVAFGLFLSRRVTHPLAQLGAAATRVRDGELVPLPRSGTGDEIDRLAALFEQAFAAVRGSVEQQKRFVADASHELRNPIAILTSIAEIGQRRDRSVGEYRDLLAEIEQVAQRMARMLESLLTLARLDAQGRMPGPAVDLAGIVRRTVADTPADVRIDVQARSALLHGDEQLLAMLCSNLLCNAVRHAEARVDVQVGSEGGHVVLRIVDDGPGLSATERERVFERFFRGREAKGQGAGLGLALVRSIVRAHGGDCRLEPSAVGLCVAVTLPGAAGDAEQR